MNLLLDVVMGLDSISIESNFRSEFYHYMQTPYFRRVVIPLILARQSFYSDSLKATALTVFSYNDNFRGLLQEKKSKHISILPEVHGWDSREQISCAVSGAALSHQSW